MLLTESIRELWHHGNELLQRVASCVKVYKELNEMLATQAKVDIMGEGWKEAEAKSRRLIEVGRLAARQQVSRLADLQGQDDIAEKDLQEGNAVLDLGREGRLSVNCHESLAYAMEKVMKNVRKSTKMLDQELC